MLNGLNFLLILLFNCFLLILIISKMIQINKLNYLIQLKKNQNNLDNHIIKMRKLIAVQSIR